MDDSDIKSLGLHRLRHSITVIPQDPVLFSGDSRVVDPDAGSDPLKKHQGGFLLGLCHGDGDGKLMVDFFSGLCQFSRPGSHFMTSFGEMTCKKCSKFSSKLPSCEALADDSIPLSFSGSMVWVFLLHRTEQHGP